jgi:hypothetical protein
MKREINYLSSDPENSCFTDTSLNGRPIAILYLDHMMKYLNNLFSLMYIVILYLDHMMKYLNNLFSLMYIYLIYTLETYNPKCQFKT